MEEFSNMQVTNLPAMGFDHFPIVMNSDNRDMKKGKRFKFEAAWLIMEECENIIKQRVG